MDYTVVGLPKCGTTSYMKYLKAKHPGGRISKFESIYDPNAANSYDFFYHGQPILITRNPADKLWSGYHYLGFSKRMTFREFLFTESTIHQNLGFNKPLESCDWRPYLEKFGKDTKIVKFEEVVNLGGFPHEKKGKYQSQISPEDRQMVYDELEKLGIDWRDL